MKSVLDQHLRDGDTLELLVVDNCSTDQTWDVIRSVVDSRVRAVRNDTNLGMFGNFNRCRELAKGEFVRYLCSDDLLAPNCLRGEVELMEQEPRASVLNTVGWMINENGEKLAQAGDFFDAGFVSGPAALETALVELARSGRNVFNFPSGVLVRKSFADRAGGFDASLLGLADFEYWLQLLRVGGLLVTKSVGCHVVEHANRESYPLFYSGHYIRGQIRVVEEWSQRLSPKSERLERVKIALGARCFWYIFKCLFAGRTDGVKTHWKIFREYRYPILPSVIEIFRQGFGRAISRG